MSVALFFLRAFVRAKGRTNQAMDELSEVSTYRAAAATLICAGSVPLAFLSPYVSIGCFVAAPALFLFPKSRPVRGQAPSPGASAVIESAWTGPASSSASDLVDHPLALDAGLVGEGGRDQGHGEVALPALARAGVAGVLVEVVADVDPLGREGLRSACPGCDRPRRP